jgi:hypothetical protein
LSFFDKILKQDSLPPDPDLIITYDFTDAFNSALFMVAAYSTERDILYVLPRDLLDKVIKSGLRGTWQLHFDGKTHELVKLVAPSGPRTFWEKP